jgi:hypothetical protein
LLKRVGPRMQTTAAVGADVTDCDGCRFLDEED